MVLAFQLVTVLPVLGSLRAAADCAITWGAKSIHVTAAIRRSDGVRSTDESSELATGGEKLPGKNADAG